ncbi:MAG: hypothetical protein IIU55_00585 [Paludibacteraceae bacterium]|nr:hypothetical protein [Paludibacteraceae bacterium]
MKKISMFFAALAVAISSLATPPTAFPSKDDLADFYEPGQLCVCVYFEEEVCNDVVFIGSYNGWDSSDPSSMAKFSPLEGFDGWYYVTVTDATVDAEGKPAIEGKPVQLKQDGSFSWDYQGGDAPAWTLISGKVDIVDGYSGECDLKNYSTEEPVILTCAYFKNHNSPCVAEIYHDYTIRLLPPFCSDPNGVWFQPAIIGSFNGWSDGVAASDIDVNTYEYIFKINDKEGGEFKFRSLEIADWTNQIQLPTEEGGWMDNENVKLGTETTISLDYSAGKYTKCGEAKDLVTLTYNVTVPEGTYTCYLVGEMNGWAFTNEMTKVDDTHFTITLDEVHDGMGYKYCSGPDWAYAEKTAAGEDVSNRTYSENDVVEAWAAVYVPTAVENVEVKASAVKTIKDGQMVIEMNGKFFNILGAEVK